MPIYSFKCPACIDKDPVDMVISLSSFERIKAGELDPPACEHCKKLLSLQITATPGKVLGGTPRFHISRGRK